MTGCFITGRSGFPRSPEKLPSQNCMFQSQFNKFAATVVYRFVFESAWGKVDRLLFFHRFFLYKARNPSPLYKLGYVKLVHGSFSVD
jgi:hypothetical protein